MTQEVPMTDHDRDGDDESLRARVRRMADSMNDLRMKQAEDRMMINQQGEAIKFISGTTATSIELRSAMEVVNLKLDGINKTIAPMKSGINWAVGLILGAVFMAVLALVLNGPPPKMLP